jgi:hypothetical protein
MTIIIMNHINIVKTDIEKYDIFKKIIDIVKIYKNWRKLNSSNKKAIHEIS